MSENRNNRILTIDTIFIVFFSMYYILPSVSAKFTFLFPFALVFVYIVIGTIRNGMKLSTIIVKYLFLIAFISFLYMILTDASSIAADVSDRGLKRFLSKYYQMAMMFFPLLFLKRIIDFSPFRVKKIVLIFSYALFAYVMLFTIQELRINPNITRAWAGFEENSANNVANYYFVYAIPFTIAISTMLVCKAKRVVIKAIMVALIIYQVYFLLLAQYTLSVLISIIGICAEIYCNTKPGRNKTVLVLLFAILAILSPWLLKMAASHVPSEQMAIRLYEIYYFLVGGDVSGYNLNGRMTLYTETIKAFLKSPFWGNRHLDFDGHATFLTVLSDLGLLGGIPFYYLYFSSLKRVRAIINDKCNCYWPVFLMLALMGFTNPIHTALPLMYVVWFLVPLSIETFMEYEEMTYEIVEN